MAFSYVADWRDSAVREVGRLMAPRILGLAATQINFYFIGMFFASTLSAGAISGLSFAWLIAMTPLGIIGMAISTAVIPTLAEQAARNDASGMAETLGRTLRLILFLSLPAGVGLALLAEPLVVVLLQRGAFDAESTSVTADALLFYAPALFAHSGIEILSRGFYALGNTRTPVLVAVGSMVVNVALAAALVQPLEVRGLALALSVATTLEFLALYLLVARRIPGLADRKMAAVLARMVVACSVMAGASAACLAALHYGASFDLGRGIDALATVVACASVGALVYAGAAAALGLEEVRLMTTRFLPRLRE
jgi:putative peptidoglycan lipid II flippase